MASVPAAGAGAGSATGAAWRPDGAYVGADTGAAGRRAVGVLTATPAPPPPLGGRCSLLSEPHLWQTLAVTEFRVPHAGHGLEPILRISSSSRSQSSNVTNVGCLRHHSWNSRSDRDRPSWRDASSRSFPTTSSYC